MNDDKNKNELLLFSKTEAAQVMSIGRDAIGILIKTGKLGFLNVGKRIMIPFKEIERFISESTTKLMNDESENIALTLIRNTNKNKVEKDTREILKKIMEKENGQPIS